MTAAFSQRLDVNVHFIPSSCRRQRPCLPWASCELEVSLSNGLVASHGSIGISSWSLRSCPTSCWRAVCESIDARSDHLVPSTVSPVCREALTAPMCLALCLLGPLLSKRVISLNRFWTKYVWPALGATTVMRRRGETFCVLCEL